MKKEKRRSIKPVPLHTLLGSPNAVAFVNPYRSGKEALQVFRGCLEEFRQDIRPFVIELTKKVGGAGSPDSPFFVIVGVTDPLHFEEMDFFPLTDDALMSYQWRCIKGSAADPLRSGRYKIIKSVYPGIPI